MFFLEYCCKDPKQSISELNTVIDKNDTKSLTDWDYSSTFQLLFVWT